MHGVIERARPLLDRLRSDTAAHHDALEAGLGLLDRPLCRDRFLGVLKGFHGFHAVWEPGAAQSAYAEFLRPRRRLAGVEQDLRSLGLEQIDIDALPRCEEASGLAAAPAAVLGASYVLEGSSLGGAVITRALSGEAWMPERGFAYFNPYGDQTGVRWRETRAFIEREGAGHHDEVSAAASRTFDLLLEWLVRR